MEWTIDDLREEITAENAHYWNRAVYGDDSGYMGGVVDDIRNGLISKDDILRVVRDVVRAANELD